MPQRPAHAIALLIGFWIAITVFLGLVAPAWAESAPADAELARMEASLHDAVNRFRAKHHKIALARRPDLDGVARGHSADMAGRRYLSHETPEG